MYLSGKKRLGQDSSSFSLPTLPDLTGALSTVNAPVSVSVSPLMLGGLGLLALAVVLHFTKQGAAVVRRKSRSVRRALRA